MGKSKKKRKSNYYKGKASKQLSKKKRFPIVPLVVVGALATGGIYMLAGGKENREVTTTSSVTSVGVEQVSNQSLKLRETRPTLSPALFTGRVAEAYRVAREIPQILDRLYCYCRCAENFNHKSLLSCYVDKHAST